jgi:phosphoglycerate dehydrogenase-like enzyme
MGEYVLAHMLSINRRLPEHAENQRRKVYKPLMQKELTGCTVAIVGAGGIGAEVARLCKAFGMRVVGTRRRAAPAPNFDAMMPADAGLEAVVVVALPHTPATRRCVGASVLAAMKPDAWLVNVSRGGVVDDAALFAALKDDAGIAGAVLDVFSTEPLPSESELWDLPNVVITPHDSYKTTRAAVDNHRYWIDNVARVARGEALLGAVAAEFLKPAVEPAGSTPDITIK